MIHFPRTYDEECVGFPCADIGSVAPLDKFGVYIFPDDKILVHSAYFKVIKISRETTDKKYWPYGLKYRWFVECQDHKPDAIYRFPADICINCSEKKVCPPFPYIDELKERTSLLRKKGYICTSKGIFKKTIEVTAN